MLGFAAIPAALLFIGALYLPESPRWLISKGFEDKAVEILRAVRIKAAPKEIDEEIFEIKEANVKESGVFKDLMQKRMRPVLVIGIGLAVFHPVYRDKYCYLLCPYNFSDIGLGDISAILSTVGIGVLNVLITILALFIMDKIDRKKMLIMGSSGMAASLILLCIVSQFPVASGNILRYITLAFLCAYIFFFALNWDPLCG